MALQREYSSTTAIILFDTFVARSPRDFGPRTRLRVILVAIVPAQLPELRTSNTGATAVVWARIRADATPMFTDPVLYRWGY